MAYKFRGTTLTFGSQVARLRAARFSKTGTQLDITHSGSSEKEFESGFPESEITFTVVGSSTIDVDDEGTTSISWTDGGGRNLGTCIVTAVNEGGDVDGVVTTEITLKKGSAA